MKFRTRKIRDFVSKLSEDISIILGSNGTGKTRELTETYNEYSGGDKNIISDTYPISAKLFARIITERELLDELTKSKLMDKDLCHVNILLGKRYENVSYVAYSIGEIIEYVGDSVDSYKEIFGNLFNEDTLEANDCYYYYIEVKTDDGLVYDTLEMGVGESQLLAFYIAFTTRKSTHFFIDEPFNYVSVKSAENFVKMLIYSSYKNRNRFTLTTNSLEIIDYLNFYKCPIAYNYKMSVNDGIAINENDYYKLYEERYSFYNKADNLIYVEDDLTQKFIYDIIPENTVECIGGSGELTALSKILKICREKDDNLHNKYYRNICVIYDGDQLEKVSPTLKEMPFIFFLPCDDIEKAICMIIGNSENIKYFKTVKSIIEFSQAAEIAKSNEAHDAYEKIKNILSMSDTMMFQVIKDFYKDDIEKLVESIREFYNAPIENPELLVENAS